MTIEIIEKKEVQIKWQGYDAFINCEDGALTISYPVSDDPPISLLQKQIANDPAGFVEFATAIKAALKANTPEPEKKPRKTRSDKGHPKKKEPRKTFEVSLDKAFARMDIHTGTGDEPHSVKYLTYECEGKTYRELFTNMKDLMKDRTDLAEDGFPTSMHPEDREFVNKALKDSTNYTKDE